MTPTNVLFLNKFREIGGSEVFLLELLSHLDRERFRAVVAPIGETSDEARALLTQQEVVVYEDLFRSTANQSVIDDKGAVGRLLSKLASPQGRRSPYDVTAIFRLAQILREEKIDVLFYLDKHAALNLAPLASILARTPAVIGSFHTPGLRFSALERALFRLTDAVIATSRFHKSYLTDVLEIDPGKITVIYNGISLSRFERAASDTQVTKDDVGIPTKAQVVIKLARLVPQKNHELLLRSAQKVVEALPQTHFLIVGEGPEREKLEAMTKELRLSKNVHFLGFREDVEQLLLLSDISVLSSRDEWLPYTLLESMLVGLPIVSTDVGAVSELVIDGETGCLVPEGDADALAQVLISLLSDPQLAQRMGEAGRREVESAFSSRRMAEQVQQLLEGAAIS